MLVALYLEVAPSFVTWDGADRAAKQRGSHAIVLYLSRSDCSFCERFEKEILKPVLASGNYDDVAIREIVLDGQRGDLNLPFAETLHELEARYHVVGTPTLLFLSHDGMELAKRVEGYSGDHYSHYRLERSLKKVQEQQYNERE